MEQMRRELRTADLVRMFNTTRQTIHRWRVTRYLDFPEPHESGKGRLAWWEDEILAWIKRRDEHSKVFLAGAALASSTR